MPAGLRPLAWLALVPATLVWIASARVSAADPAPGGDPVGTGVDGSVDGSAQASGGVAVPPNWLLRTARMEGASVNITEEAALVASTAAEIRAGGRLTALARLRSDADALHRRVISGTLAAEVLDQP